MELQHEQMENTDNIKAVYLAAEDLKIAASILYLAYYDDPLFSDIFQSEKEGYESRLRSAIREELNAFWLAKQPMIGLFNDDRLVAVACMVNPGGELGPNRFWHWRLRMLLTAGYFGTKQMVDKENKVRERVPAEHFHMLSLIGVHPGQQNHGLGVMLMSAIEGIMLEDLNSQGVGMYVTLTQCLSFFKNSHYNLVEELEVGNIKGHLMSS